MPKSTESIKFSIRSIICISLLLVSFSSKAFVIDSFPDTWIGVWKGTLEIYNNVEKKMEIPMELHILPIENSENLTWHIIYGEDKVTGLRPYELITVDSSKGHYVIDEKNSILIDNYYLAGKLKSLFEVKGTLIAVSIEKINKMLEYEIVVGNHTSPTMTGDTIIGDEEIPSVTSYPFTGIQRATLTRQ